MSIPRVKGTGWGLNEKLTSAQITALDQNVANLALDKSAAGDTLSGLITVAAASGFVFQSTAVAHFQSGSGPQFDNGAFLAFQSGAAIALTCGISGATLTAAAGITWVLNGAVTIGGAAIFGAAVTIAGATAFNGAATFNSTITVAGTNKVLLGARSIERLSKQLMQAEGSLDVAQTKLLVTASDAGDQELDIPHGATLTDVRVGVHPFGAPPAGTKNQLKIYKIDLSNVVTTLGSIATDPTTSGTYAGLHKYLFSAGGGGALSEVVDRTQYRYFASLLGESGTGAGSVYFLGASAIFTPASYDDGAA